MDRHIEPEKDNVIRSVYEKLLYHNQFVLGPTYVASLPSWQKMKVNNTVHLTVHPDLNAIQAFHGGKSLTLLGFILDPDDPDKTDTGILNELILKLSDSYRFIRHTYPYGGRWILIVDDGKNKILLNDAVGLRQVFYDEIDSINPLWCASQPGMIAKLLDLVMDPDAIDFINSYEFRKNPEFRFPGNSTPYLEIKHLLANHYLNLDTGQCKRYWPHEALPELPPTEAIERVSATLKGLIKGASNRFDLALSTTAGLDSRVVLAASKEIKDSVSYMTVRQIAMPDDHADITSPTALLSGLGFRHDVVKSSLIIDDAFLEIFKKNVPIPHYIYAPDAHAIYNYYGQTKVVVTGSASEVSRSSFRALSRNKPKDKKITSQDLARLQEMGEHKFALDHFEKWRSGIGNLYNLDILNLFEWELDDGNWLAMCQLEFDIAWKDIFTPFNCRRVITDMLSVKQEYMMPPKYELYHTLIHKLWPEVLSVAINPHKKKNSGFSSRVKASARARLLRILS